MKIALVICAILGLLLDSSSPIAAESYGNLEDFIRENERPRVYRPGTWVILPNGIRSQILEEAPGGYRTDSGVVITPEGVILEGEGKGEKVRVETPDLEESQNKTSLPEKRPEDKPEIAPAEKPAVVPVPEKKEEPAAQNQQEIPKAAKPAQEERLTLAQMLPVTELPEAKTVPPRKEKPKETPIKEPQKKKPEKAPEKKVEEKPKKPEKKEYAKPKAGQELRIPPNAAKSGDLSFLEGCWQGTRPEYISKRTIRECFCFGANGRNGKRRVIDPSFNRMCIGSSRAQLSKDGVLHVISSGAACSDGERWGQAEMVCRNSGPRTPCSWVFRDAQNGRQSYQIPFVRVDSCGR